MKVRTSVIFCITGCCFAALVPAQQSDEGMKPTIGTAFDGDVITESGCGILASEKGMPTAVHEVAGLGVLGRTEDNPLKLVQRSGANSNGVVCWRSEARLVANDYPKDRTIVLEPASGSYRVRHLSGPKWSAAEEEEIQRLIELYVQKAPVK